MKKRFLKLISLILVLVVLAFNFGGCSRNKVVINPDGSYNLKNLTPVIASTVKTQNNRQVIYHNNSPYLFYAMHLRYDHLKRHMGDIDIAKLNFDTYAKQVKADVWDTIIIYIRWSQIFDGEKYDFSELEYQYSVAKKYDLKIHINWFGYNVCGYGGYMDWQKGNIEKYPPLKNDDGTPKLNDSNEYIPDYSQKIFLDEAYDSIQQLCAWLNVNDTDRRTVAIQLENEPDHIEGGNGSWMSQFDNMANHINNLGKAVKESPYSMVTYINLMGTSTERVRELIDMKYIDIVGWDLYSGSSEPRKSFLEYGDNLPLFAEMGICVYNVPGQINYCFNNGYGLGFYMFTNLPNTSYNTGFYRYQNALTGIEKRDGTQVIPYCPFGTMRGNDELKHSEVVALNNSVRAISDLIATQRLDNIVCFNNEMEDVIRLNKSCNNQNVIYNCNRPKEKYGSSGLCIGADDGNFYLYSSQDAEYIFESNIKEVTCGSYKNGKWTSDGSVEVNNNSFIAKSGKAYRVIIK